MRILRPLSLSLLLTALATLVAAQGHLPPRPGPRMGRNAVLPQDYVTHRRPLPDSVLVRLSRGNWTEDVTMRRFERAVRLLGGRPEALTPQDRDRFLQNVLDQRVLAARAARLAIVWSPADSGHFRFDAERILTRAAYAARLRALEDHRRALGQPALDGPDLGIAARESLMAQLAPRWEEQRLAALVPVFAELPEVADEMTPEQMSAALDALPRMPAGDSLAALVHTRDGDLTVADLMASWRRILSAYRPRVATTEDLRAVAANALFERTLQRDAADPALARQPEVAATLADRAEFRATTTLVNQQVIDRVVVDSLAVRRFFRADSLRFATVPRVLCVFVTLTDSAAADSLVQRFRVPGEAESLAFRAQRAGTNFTRGVQQDQDPRFFAEASALGVGGAGGPIHMTDGWLAFYVLGIEPKRARAFEEAYPDAKAAYTNEENDRLLRELLDDERRRLRIERNEPALRRVVTAPAGR